MITAKNFKLFTWLLGLTVLGLAVTAWYNTRLSDSGLDDYELFPLLGISAFSLMWTHYVTDALRRKLGFDDSVIKRYFAVTAWIVLALILLHPLIFYIQLQQDGFGLPPGSYFKLYPDIMSRFALILGTMSLVAFLAFELHRRFSKASWWRYIEYANVVAMFAIFYHALRLGGEVAEGWFRILWFFYAIILALAITYTYQHKKAHNEEI